MDYTTTELLASVRQRASIPTSQTTFTAAKILRFANEEMKGKIVPFILKTREEYFVTYKDVPSVASQIFYRMPERAIGAKLRDVAIVQADGTFKHITRMDPGERETAATGTPERFFLEGNYVGLYPTPIDASLTLRMWYYARPGELVETSACRQATVVSSIAVTAMAGSDTFSVSTPLDFIRGNPGFETLAIDKAPTAGLTSTVATFVASIIPADFAVGDWLALAGRSPIPQIPYELHPILYQRTAIKVLEAIGDTDELKAARIELKEMSEFMVEMVSNRVDGKTRVIMSDN